jgi:hypothetical protein
VWHIFAITFISFIKGLAALVFFLLIIHGHNLELLIPLTSHSAVFVSSNWAFLESEWKFVAAGK